MLELDQNITLALNGSDNLFWDNIIITYTNTWYWMLFALALLIVMFKNNDVRDFLLIIVTVGVMIAVADRICSGLVKPMVARWRPTQDPQIMYMLDVVEGYRGGRFGFFSGHACNSFCLATFLAMVFRHKGIGAGLYLWAIMNAYTRVYLGVHYFGDILVGMIVGVFIGFAFYAIYDRISNRFENSRSSSDKFTVTGYNKSDLNSILAVEFLNCAMIIIVGVIKGV